MKNLKSSLYFSMIPITQPLLQLLRETWKFHRSDRYLFHGLPLVFRAVLIKGF